MERVRQARRRRTDWADLPEHKAGFFMRTPAWCQAQATLAGPACSTLAGELLSVNALFRRRQAQGVLRLGQRHGDARLEAACARALEVGDPSYRTVKGILAAGTEPDGAQPLALVALPMLAPKPIASRTSPTKISQRMTVSTRSVRSEAIAR